MADNTKARILVVEDESFIAKLMSDALIGAGFEVDLAVDGDAALKKFESEPLPDLVLLDLILPGTGGFEVLEKLKADERTKHVPVVILSNLGSEQEIQKGMDLGAEKYFVKANVLPSQVVETANEVLGLQ